MAKLILKNAPSRATAPPPPDVQAPPPPPKASTSAPPPPAGSTEPVPALVKLKQNADALNAVTDAASASVKYIEEFLSQECSIGFHSYVLVRGPDEVSPESIYLEYRRIGTKYRIAVVVVSEQEPDQEYARAWSDCSRNLKIESIEKLPDLIDKIIKQVELEVASANEAMQTVNNVLSSLTGKGA